MDVIFFLYVSLGSSTVQLHGSLGSVCACSETGFSSQNGDRALGVFYRRTAFCCAFLWAKGLNAKDIHKEMFPVYGGKCFLCKAVHNWVEKFSQGRSKVADDVRKCAEVAETTVKRLLFCGFRHTGKAMGQVYQCWLRICGEINALPTFAYRIHVFYVLYLFVTYLQTLRRISYQKVFRNKLSLI
jgi:hypothetical protein